jgi:hypothetical protein
MKTLKSELAVFEDLIVPKNCHENQRREMKRCFMTGAFSMLSLLKEVADMEDEDAGVAILKASEAFIDDFYQRMTAGDA